MKASGFYPGFQHRFFGLYSIKIRCLRSRSTCQHVDPFKPRNYYFLIEYIFSSLRNAYRAEVATFLVPVAGEDASSTRLRERIEFSSNILFFIEDLYLALGPGHVTTQAGSKINVVASLLWVRNQHASNLKELMIAKKTGWAVLRNFKNQVSIFRL